MHSTFLFAAFLCLASPALSLVAGNQQPMEAMGGPVHTLAGWGWKDCGLPTDAVQLESIQVSPDPPQPGKDLTVTVKAIVQREIEDGAYADVTVKLGLIKLLRKNFDICEEARKVNATVQCPVQPGPYTIVQTVALPKEIPQAKFSVDVLGYTADEDDMVCVKLLISAKCIPLVRIFMRQLSSENKLGENGNSLHWYPLPTLGQITQLCAMGNGPLFETVLC